MNEDEKKEQSEGSNSDSETENSVEKEVKSEESTKVVETQEAEMAQGKNEAPKETEDSAKESKEVSQETEKSPQEGPKSVEDVKKEEKPQEPTEPKKEVKVSSKLAGIIKDIEVLTVLELADLVKALEDKFGVSASAPPVAISTASVATSGGDEAAEEGQTTFNVIIAESGTNKIGVIKAVRGLVPTLGLKEAKDLVDAAPKQVLEGVGKDAANEAKQKLETAGAKVELQ